MTLSAMGSELA